MQWCAFHSKKYQEETQSYQKAAPTNANGKLEVELSGEKNPQNVHILWRT